MQADQPNRTPRRSSPISRAVGRGSRRVAARVSAMFAVGGPGFAALARAHAANVAGDTLVTMALAGTLFFQVPSNEARGNVALYLVLTLAPFAVLGPLLIGVYRRFPTAYRGGLVLSHLARMSLAIAMLAAGLESIWLFPLAFGLLIFSRIHGISRSSLLPIALEEPIELVAANARLARIGVFASAVAVPPGAGLVALAPWTALVVAVAVFAAGAIWSGSVPKAPPLPKEERHRRSASAAAHRGVRLARLATAGVRFLNGFLLALVAFAFRDQDAGVLDFGALLGAAGAGFFLAAVLSPILERRLREEPMVFAALAVEAAAAFIAAQVFGLGAAAALAAAAGLAWGTAKFAFDGLLQAAVGEDRRGQAFTISETAFQMAWVIGALVPVALDVPVLGGLAAAGIVALGIQLVYISALLIPLAEARRAEQREPPEPAGPEPRRVTDLL